MAVVSEHSAINLSAIHPYNTHLADVDRIGPQKLEFEADVILPQVEWFKQNVDLRLVLINVERAQTFVLRTNRAMNLISSMVRGTGQLTWEHITL